jgi:hypothetical protein
MRLCYTATSGAVKQRKILEYRYYPQEAEYYYHDDERHCYKKHVAAAHCSTSLEIHPAPERSRHCGRASLEELEEQIQNQEDQ